jgi:hypothetical protein
MTPIVSRLLFVSNKYSTLQRDLATDTRNHFSHRARGGAECR